MQSLHETTTGFGAYKRLLSYTLNYRLGLLLAMLGMVIYSASQAGFVSLTKPLMDQGFVDKNYAAIGNIILMILGVFVVRGVGTFLSTYFMALVGRRVIKTIRAELFTQLLNMPAKIYDRLASGELVSILTYNVEQVAEASTNAITIIVRDTCTILFLFGLMFYRDPLLTLVFVVAGPLIALIVYMVNLRVRKISKRIQQSMGHVTHVASEAIDGHRVVKIFGGEETEADHFEKVNEYNRSQNMKLFLTMSYSIPIVQVIAGLSFAGIVYVATAGWLSQPMTSGDFTMFIGAVLLIFQPLKHVTQVSSVLQKGVAAAQSIFSLLDSEKEKDEGGLSLKRSPGKVEYRNVSFSYAEGEKPVLRNISLHVHAGETIALVGRSGSGKSTLVNLLPRFYEVSDGAIYLDDKNITRYRLRDLRDQISYVGQNVTLFNDTVANNIAYGRLADTRRDKIIAAAEAANAMDFIRALPQGLDTMIGEDGILLSGGQRQRLAIARALLKDAPILILDEATSALDSESEQLIQEALDNLLQNRTTFVIAHRLSTVEKADRILVLQEGEIVESGSHKALLAKSGQYASLHRLQFNTNLLVDEPPKPVQIPAQALQEFSLEQPMNFLKEEQGATLWERIWYGHHPAAPLLVPFSYLFGLLVWARKWLYRINLLKRYKADVPVIVVGNITVGGTGKTPLVIWLAEHLQALGYKPGIISRGYKGRAETWPVVVTETTDASAVGDEALMMATRTGCPTVVGPKRAVAVEKLLAEFDCDIVISDDGLQHYALARDLEVLVADGARGFGNGLLLPAGPMREWKGRLKSVDLVVVNGARLPDAHAMFIRGDTLVNLHDETQEVKLARFAEKTVHAVAAIGNPERFFNLLRKQGLQVIEHAYPDHYDFSLKDLSFDDELPVIMTEKDAVKCRKYVINTARGRLWYLPVRAELSDEFAKTIDEYLESIMHGQKAA